jgi:hypothetical protein
MRPSAVRRKALSTSSIGVNRRRAVNTVFMKQTRDSIVSA